MADSGCQSCLASVKVIQCLGLCKDDRILVTMRMHATNNNGIKILGAVLLRFSGRSPFGQTMETQQIVYVTSDSDKLFLRQETCTALGMISENFPTVGEAIQVPKEIEQETATYAAGHHPQVVTLHIPESATAHAIRNHHSSSRNCPSQQLRRT